MAERARPNNRYQNAARDITRSPTSGLLRRREEASSYTPTWQERIVAGVGDVGGTRTSREFASRLLGSPENIGLLDLSTPIEMQEAYATRSPLMYGMAAIPVVGVGAKLAAKAAKTAAKAATTAVRRGGLLGVETLAPKATKAAKAVKTVAKKPVTKAVKRGTTTDLVNLRDLDVDEALSIARGEPHLVMKPDGSGFVGGPPGVKTKADLIKLRKKFDRRVLEGKEGGDWYERYRAGIEAATGGDPRQSAQMAQHLAAQSAGRAAEHEVQSSLLETMSALTGKPKRGNYGAQLERFKRSIAENDPEALTRGTKKTSEYARKITPSGRLLRNAVGTNDFRQANNWGFKVGSGTSKTSLTAAQHRFVDYENALAVERLRKRAGEAMSDWTGEEVQAAPWVVDKAWSLVAKRNLVQKHQKAGLSRRAAEKAAYNEAFTIANRTGTDAFPRHTFRATHEAQPGESVGFLPGSVSATPEERLAYGNDPLSQWGYAPGGRDAIYAGLSHPDAPGVAARVLPSTPAAGWWGGRSNPVEVGNPLVPFAPGSPGTIHPDARKILEAGEALRAGLDAQDAGAGHLLATTGRGGLGSVSVPMNRPMTPDEMFRLSEAGKTRGLPDVSDTGVGVTVTNFQGTPRPRGGLLDVIQKAAPKDAGEAFRARVDSVFEPLEKRWAKGEGSGAVTRYILKKLNVTKGVRDAFDNNPYLGEGALNRIVRDREWMKKWGVGRKDVERFRQVFVDGPGWIGRLEKMVKEQPGLLPALAAGVFVGLNETVEQSQD